ncbi:MAG: hypothetical protein P8Y70_21260 [Candidatus Lokiarchaeota archaeon]
MLLSLAQYDDHYYMMNWILGIFGPFWWIAMIIGMSSYLILSILIAIFIHRVQKKISFRDVIKELIEAVNVLVNLNNLYKYIEKRNLE